MLFMVRPDAKSVTLLADALETIEVTADELLDQRFAPHDLDLAGLDGDAAVQARLAALRMFVRQVRDLELTLLTKLEQARVRARTVARSDWRLRPIMSLFTSGTQALADHIASPQGRAAMRFDGSDQVYPFLRSRELLPAMAEHYDGAAELLVTDSFRILGLIKVSDLLERCEVALNALDAHYDLYDWPAEEASQPEEVVVEPPRIAAVAAVASAPVAIVVEAKVEPIPEAVVGMATVVSPAEDAAPVALAAEVESAAEASAIRGHVAMESVAPIVSAAAETAVAPAAVVSEEAAETVATNWGEGIPATIVAAKRWPSRSTAETIGLAPEHPDAEAPSKEAIAIAEAAAEDSLKSLSERLADLRQGDPAVPVAEQTETAKSDAA